MKCRFIIVLLLALALSAPALAEVGEVVSFTANDGVELIGKLRLPDSTPVKRLIFFVNGSGPNTYDNHRTTGESEYDYYDIFASNLTSGGAAFFSYNTRGVTAGSEPPFYADIDAEIYKTYLPENCVDDVIIMVNELLKRPELHNAEVYLLGWSEGTVIAPMVALEGGCRVDALLLAGYVNIPMDQVLLWQQSGESSMIFYQDYFDQDGDGRISRGEYESDPNGVVPYLGAEFDEIDLEKDGFLTAEDFYILLKDSREAVFRAFETGDDEWLWENYPVPLTSRWYLEHCALTPNSEIMPRLDLPIYIFQGTRDANVSVQGAYDVKAEFDGLGKTNLTLRVYEGADHNLNYLRYVYSGEMSEGFADIFNTCLDGL